MPNLDNLPITKYDSLHPYTSYYDNLPINDIETQIMVVNSQVNLNQNALEESIGNTGSLANRLNKSLNANGSLKSSAIDNALHSIAEHEDADGFVRMTEDERNKLDLIDEEATNLSVEVRTISSTVVFPDADDVFTLVDSDTITWQYDSGLVSAETTFALSLITTPSYDIVPVNVSGADYKTTSLNTPYKAGSLRVYVNGLRISRTGTIGGFSYTETTPSSGLFSLNTALGGSDKIRIDFDQPLS